MPTPTSAAFWTLCRDLGPVLRTGMPRCVVSVLAALMAFVTTWTAEAAPAHKPRFAKQWAQVNAHIASAWDGEISKAAELPAPFVGCWPGVPFMFYWDTYFIATGLIAHQRPTLARNNARNLLSIVEKHGYMGNAAPTAWGMNRSQPPYLSPLVRLSYENPPAPYNAEAETRFLRKAYDTLKKEYAFWTDATKPLVESHKTAIEGLARFGQHVGQKELESFHEEYSKRLGLPPVTSAAEKLKLAQHMACEAATGMDFTWRFEHRCLDFAPVELNTNLWLYETNFAWMVATLKLQGEPDWQALADQRKALINKYLWDDTRGIYVDYDATNGKQSRMFTALGFAPLWAGLASPVQAARVIKNLPLIERPWGVITNEPGSAPRDYQWGENSIWAPMQAIVVHGLLRYGARADAKRVAGKFLDLVTKNFIEPQPKTYVDAQGKTVERATQRTFEKYHREGGINDLEYKATTMMGWTAGVFADLFALVTRNR